MGPLATEHVYVLPKSGQIVYAIAMFETVAEFNARMKRLQALACPTAADVDFFNTHIEIAGHQGLNYREGLEFVICMRNGGSD